MSGRRLTALLLASILVSVTARGDRTRFEEESFQHSYRAVLGEWARGAGERAVGSLVALESSVVGDGPRLVEPMWRAKLRVLRDLIGEGGLEVLAPVALLHEQTYLEYLDRSDSILTAHARTMTAELLEFYAEKAEDRQNRLLAAAIMTSLAGHVQDASLLTASARLYRRVLEIDPDNPAALQGLSGMLEKHGEYEAAVEQLEVLAAADSGNREGLLRLAINLRRVERVEEAMSLLRQLKAGEETDWVTSLAYQELARMLMEEGNHMGAREILREALDRLPDEPTLAIQWSYLRDRQGAPLGLDLKASLARSAREAREPARRRYLQTPRTSLEELRQTLKSHGSEHLATLLDALEKRGTQSEPTS